MSFLRKEDNARVSFETCPQIIRRNAQHFVSFN